MEEQLISYDGQSVQALESHSFSLFVGEKADIDDYQAEPDQIQEKPKD